MDTSEIRSYIHKVIDENDLLPGGNIIEDDVVLKDYGLDSIGVVDLIATIEEEYGFVFDNSELELENFKTISSIADLIKRKVEKLGV